MLRWLLNTFLPHDMEGARSGEWPRVRAEHIAKQPACVVCGDTSAVEVHHVVPVHIANHRELDPSNLRTVCRDDHYLFGHCRDWKAYNPDFDRDTDRARHMIEQRKYR